jgi:hypothetical protein
MAIAREINASLGRDIPEPADQRVHCLNFILMILDNTTSNSVKKRAMSELRSILKDELSASYALDILLSAPYPDDAVIPLPWTWWFSNHRLYKLMRLIVSSQPKIRLLRSKFDDALTKRGLLDIEASIEARLLQGLMASGPFKILVTSMNDQGSIPSFILENTRAIIESLLEKSKLDPRYGRLGPLCHASILKVVDDFFSKIQVH